MYPILYNLPKLVADALWCIVRRLIFPLLVVCCLSYALICLIWKVTVR